MTFWGEDAQARFGGMWIATNAQYRSTVVQYAVWPEPYWYLPLGNPHLAVDGTTPTSGSFTAWVPPGYFDALDTTAADAAATGFSIGRVDGETTTSVSGAASLVDGGVYLRLPALHYSTPTIEVRGLQDGDARTAFAPDAPYADSVTAGANRATVAVRPPHFDGGVAVTKLTLRCAQGGFVRSADAGPSATQISATGLLTGVPATCAVTARNSAGIPVSSRAVTTTPSGIAAPLAPTHLKPTIANGRTLKLAWTAPTAPGSSAIARYNVQVCKPTGCGQLKKVTTTGVSAQLALTGARRSVSRARQCDQRNRDGRSRSDDHHAALVRGPPARTASPYAPAMQGSVTVNMDASPERVFALITDVTNIGRYSPETFDAQWLDGSSGPALGAKFRGHVKRNGRGPVYWTTCEIVAYETPREFAFAVLTAGRAVNTWRYVLEPKDDGTEVTESFALSRDLPLRIYWALFGKARGRTNTNGMRTTLERIKADAERPA